MKLFKDKDLTEEIKDQEPIDLGTIEAGETKEYTFYILNDADVAIYDINFKLVTPVRKSDLTAEEKFIPFASPELQIVAGPSKLPPRGVDELQLKWQSEISVEDPTKVSLFTHWKELHGRFVS